MRHAFADPDLGFRCRKFDAAGMHGNRPQIRYLFLRLIRKVAGAVLKNTLFNFEAYSQSLCNRNSDELR